MSDIVANADRVSTVRGVDKITQDADQSDPLEDVDDGKNKLVGVVFAGDDSHLED